MKKVGLTVGTVGLVLLAAACSGGAGEPAPFDQGVGLGDKLEAATGVKWRVSAEREGVRVLAPEVPVRLGTGTAEEQATGFFRQFGGELQIGPDEAKVSTRTVEEDGVEYLRVQQNLPGSQIPIFDATTTMSFDASGRVEVILPGFRSDASDVSTEPTITAAAADTIARKEWLGKCEHEPADVRASQPVLGAVAHGPSLRLAYRVAVGSPDSDCQADRYDIDAKTGIVLSTSGAQGVQDTSGGVRFARGLDSNDKKSFEVSEVLGVRSMISTSPIVRCSTYGGLGFPISSNVAGAWDDGKGAAVDAYFHTVEALRFFRDGLKRNGLDGEGLGVSVVVHDNSARNAYGMNACFRGGRPPMWSALKLAGARLSLPEIHIGDGGGDWLPFSAAYDVLAHELGHGIIGYSSQLVYEGESGALNEAFADVIAVSAKEWSRLRGQPSNFLVGEKMMWSGKGGLRDMENPMVYRDPDHVSIALRCKSDEAPDQKKNDHCYVHSNSGIGNKAFSLMVKGGTHYGFGIPKAIGWEPSRMIWYRALTHVGSRATFLQAAEAQVVESRRFGTNAFLATACAWIAVGVLPAERLGNAKAVCQETLELGKAAPTEGCSGIEEGYACHESAPYAAYVCKKGAIAGGINCANTGKLCRRRSEIDPRASVDSNGQLVCD